MATLGELKHLTDTGDWAAYRRDEYDSALIHQINGEYYVGEKCVGSWTAAVREVRPWGDSDIYQDWRRYALR